MKIYTKTGDSGETGLFGGKRLSKAHMRIEAYGTVDELNAHIGYLSEQVAFEQPKHDLITLQSLLFNMGSQLAVDPEDEIQVPKVSEEHIAMLEERIDAMESEIPPLRNFILPSGHPHGAYAHIARTVCRRAERRVVALAEVSKVDPLLVRFLNRLSDYLFVLARYLTIQSGGTETPWKGR